MKEKRQYGVNSMFSSLPIYETPIQRHIFLDKIHNWTKNLEISMCTAINYLYNGMLLRLKKILYLASPEYHEMLFVQKCFLWKQFLLTFKSHTISWHSTDILFFYHINILLLIDVVDNRNKTKPRKFLVYRDIAIIDINSKTTKIFDGILSD